LKKSIFIQLIIGLTFLNSLTAQENDFNTDSLFQVARELAFSGERMKAIELAEQIILKSPEYWDAYVLMGRVYAWNKNYSKARSILNGILEKKSYKDAYLALLDVEHWNGNYIHTIQLVDSALLAFPDDPDLLFRKAKAHFNLDELDDAQGIMEDLVVNYPENDAYVALLNKIKALNTKNQLGISSEVDFFSSVYSNRFLTVLDYKRITKLGSIIPRLNLANRFNKVGMQYEIDLYPKLKNHFSLYLNYGFSQSSLFPDHRMGAELYRGLIKGFESSLGIRVLWFNPKPIHIFTGSVGKYKGNYYYSLRPFITPRVNGISSSYHFAIRKYLNDKLDYLNMVFSFGRSADSKMQFITQDDFDVVFFKSQQIRLNYSKQFKVKYDFQIGTSLQRMELPFKLGSFIFNYNLELGIKRRF
jgi:YaiO family outer membrane protein